jgi:sugar lactone lactonase YvrE
MTGVFYWIKILTLDKQTLKTKRMKIKLLIPIAFLFLFKVRLTSQIQINTIAGNGTLGYTGNGGPAMNALLNQPNQLAFDQAGNLYVAEDRNHVVRKISPGGVNISLVAGNGTMGFSGDGGPAINAQLNRACGVAVDAAGNVYICDADNNRIRKVDISTGFISTIAGTGVNGHSGDGGQAAAADIGFASNIQVDATGNIYFACQNGSYSVRKINTSGIISTIAGNGTSGYSGDGGPATSAQLTSASAICFDAVGNLYISDFGGMRVRKVNTSGIISTIAGTGSAGSGGDGGPATSAQLFYPYGLAVDAANNLYICDAGNNKIRKVDAFGNISTFAGIGGIFGGYTGDGGPPVNAEFRNPSAIVCEPFTSNGLVYIGDYANHAVRRTAICTCSGIEELDENNSFGVFPNPNQGDFKLTFKKTGTYSLINSTGKVIQTFNVTGNDEELNLQNYSQGIYYLSGKEFNKKIVITK